MLTKLHRNAGTTHAIRRALRESRLPVRTLAAKYNLNRATVRKWRSRESTEDRSHRPHKLNTTLTPAQEEVVVAVRKTLLLPLDDLLVVTGTFINEATSRSGPARCLKRHGVSNLNDLKPKEEKPGHKTFKDYEPGYLHADIKYLPRMASAEPKRSLRRH